MNVDSTFWSVDVSDMDVREPDQIRKTAEFDAGPSLYNLPNRRRKTLIENTLNLHGDPFVTFEIP